MFLTRPPLATHSIATAVLPLDLHVLGLPPAFTLSQDQTLQFNLCIYNRNFQPGSEESGGHTSRLLKEKDKF